MSRILTPEQHGVRHIGDIRSDPSGNLPFWAQVTVISTTIAAGSDGAVLPQGTINVASTAGFPSSGSIVVGIDGSGSQTITYTGTTSTTFTGCTGGTGTLHTNQTVNFIYYLFNRVDARYQNQLVQTPGSDFGYFFSANGEVLKNGQFVKIERAFIDPNTMIGQWIYVTYEMVVSLKVRIYNPGNAGGPTTTTIDASMDGLILPQATITVNSTTTYPTSGQIAINSTGGGSPWEVITYTGISGNSFTGCAGGTGTLHTGQGVQLWAVAYTWVKPTNLGLIEVEVTGGGAAAGSASGALNQSATSGGGGGGEWRYRKIDASLLPATVIIMVGVGGVCKLAGGGTTGFGTFVTSQGGLNGANAGPTAGQQVVLGGVGGSLGTNGDLVIQGQSGGLGVVINGTTGIGWGGEGGTSHLGGTLRPSGGSNIPISGYGAGSSGATIFNSVGTQVAHNGQDGVCIVREWTGDITSGL